ncbi:MAG TPA: NAD(P)-dependent alcohol dehydrogenase [Actinomycetota bacterium]|nr:NAD(P)-dependent alcohol dehydrogenase [Actinomycetota bacterium]
MRAVVQDRYGPPADLVVLEVPTPVPGEGEVLVRVRASAVHPDVWHVVTGQPAVLRIMGAGVRRPHRRTPGTDLSGVIESLGPGVERYRPGDEVFGEVVKVIQWRNAGTWAEFAAVPADLLSPKPDGMTFEEAGGVPTSGLIALRALRDQGLVRAGQRVLVNGAAGGVGGFAVQIATAWGAEVTGVDRADKLDLVRSFGAARVIDAAEDYTRGDERYDLVFDIPGDPPFSRARRVIADGGSYVLIGHDAFGARGHRWVGSLGTFAGQLLRTPFVGPLHGLRGANARNDGDMDVLSGLIENGHLRVTVDRAFPLEEAGAAIAYLASGRARGRIVITP